MWRLSEPVAKLLEQARFPEPWLAYNLDELTLARARALPTFDEESKIVLATNQRRISARAGPSAAAASPRDPE
jgi:hypothetical protein